jgi:hypothetical protein
MQCVDMLSRVFLITLILYDIICNAEAFFPAGLRSDYATRLFLVFRISRQETAELNLFTAVDNQHPVHEICHR